MKLPLETLYDYSAWLIERADKPQQFLIYRNGMFDWTDNADKSIHFNRRDDAEQIAEILTNEDIKISEHLWPSQSAQPVSAPIHPMAVNPWDKPKLVYGEIGPAVAAPTSEEVEEYNSKMWEAAACGRHGNRYCESDQVWDSTCVHCAERFTAIRDYTASLEARPMIVTKPGVNSGRPYIARTGTPVHAVKNRHRAGESIQLIAQDYELSVTETEAALQWTDCQENAHQLKLSDTLAATLREVEEWLKLMVNGCSNERTLREAARSLLSRIRTNTNQSNTFLPGSATLSHGG